MKTDTLKQLLGQTAIDFIQEDLIIGVGTGSTVSYFIQSLAKHKNQIQGAVASSLETEQKLKALHITTLDLNSTSKIDIYIDGADAFNENKQLIKGGGGAFTREKLLACIAKQFICLVDETKPKQLLQKTPVPIEVIPIARSFVAREIVKLGGNPSYREGVLTDNGNIILDVYNFNLIDPLAMEITFKSLTGVVESGLFAKRTADKILIATSLGIQTID